jgi:branched-chain amino acid aminotransferase
MTQPSHSPLVPTGQIWRNGALIPWDEARIHVLSHVVSYGSAVFEGLRSYETPAGPALFRLDEHVQRLLGSAKVYRMEASYTGAELAAAVRELVRVNGLPACYVRLIVLRGYGAMGVLPSANPVEVFMACWEWGTYLGDAAVTEGVDACVSSWSRMAPNTLPALAKSAANYMNSQLIKMEAVANGYQEGIALDASGAVSEGSGENVFLVRNGKILTPPLSSSVLEGITRNTVLQLARDLRIPVAETPIPREMLYLADEVFFSGTAAEITPVRSIDRIPVGTGRRGPVTERLQSEFFAILRGTKPDRHGWLTPLAETRRMSFPISLPSFVRVP